MGCLNSNQDFEHWFANIHLSGPCNRACYFCIGQHMMELDSLNNLNTFPLKNLFAFIAACVEKKVSEVNITGTNTDPLLYQYTERLWCELFKYIPNLKMGIRTNGVAANRYDILRFYDKGSITICSTDPNIYRQMMGQGNVPDISKFMKATHHFSELKVNIVMGPENTVNGDIMHTLDHLFELGIKKVNLREPYGQPHVGDMLAYWGARPVQTRYGMPVYDWRGMEVMYWDVHYVEVESINLYASGRISVDYPITRGHSETGIVLDQSNFDHGRHNEQWQGKDV